MLCLVIVFLCSRCCCSPSIYHDQYARYFALATNHRLLDMAFNVLAMKKDLCNYLEVIDSGRFAISGRLENANNPALIVKRV